MRIIKERKSPKGTPVKVAVNDLPGRNSLTIKPESSILKKEDNEHKTDGTQAVHPEVKEPVVEENGSEEVSESKDGTGSSRKYRRSKKDRTKNK